MSLDPLFSTEQFGKGLAVRRAVLGSEYVDKSIAGVHPFMKPLQKMVTEWCWGEVWTRPGIDRKMRSAINLAMLTALNRPAELKLHVRGALNNGLTQEEIQEILLQACIYCGVPAALEAFKSALEIIREEDAQASQAGARHD